MPTSSTRKLCSFLIGLSISICNAYAPMTAAPCTCVVRMAGSKLLLPICTVLMLVYLVHTWDTGVVILKQSTMAASTRRTLKPLYKNRKHPSSVHNRIYSFHKIREPRRAKEIPKFGSPVSCSCHASIKSTVQYKYYRVKQWVKT